MMADDVIGGDCQPADNAITAQAALQLFKDNPLLPYMVVSFGDRPLEPPPPDVTIMPIIERHMDELLRHVPTMNVNGKSKNVCPDCGKGYPDFGAIRMHYSAVHLKTMYRCVIPGCGLWFNSQRSRNRHSSNTNAELHSGKIVRPLPLDAILIGEGDDDELREAMSRARRKGISTSYPTPIYEATLSRASTTSSAMSSPMSSPISASRMRIIHDKRIERLKRRGSTCSDASSAIFSKVRRVDSSHPLKEEFPTPKTSTPTMTGGNAGAGGSTGNNFELDQLVNRMKKPGGPPKYTPVTIPPQHREWLPPGAANGDVTNEQLLATVPPTFTDFAKRLLFTLIERDVNGFFQGPCPTVGLTCPQTTTTAADSSPASSSSSVPNNNHMLCLRNLFRQVALGKLTELDDLRGSICAYFEQCLRAFPENSLPFTEAKRLLDLSEHLCERAVNAGRSWAQVVAKPKAEEKACEKERTDDGAPSLEDLLLQDERDESLLAAHIEVLNPDNRGIVGEKERVRTIGEEVHSLSSGTHTLICDAKSSNVNCVIPYEYVDYGPFASFAPTYDSGRAMCLRSENRLLLTRYPMGLLDDLDPMVKEILPEPGLDTAEGDISLYLLNALTRSVLKEYKKQQPPAPEEEVSNKEPQKVPPTSTLVDLDAERSSVGDVRVDEHLQRSGKLLADLHVAQNHRLLLPGMQATHPSPEEGKLARESLTALQQIVAMCPPRELVSQAAVRRALGMRG